MTQQDGVISVHNFWTIPVSNVAHVGVKGFKIYIYLKDPVIIYGEVSDWLLLESDNKMITDRYYRAILGALRGGYASIRINSDEAPPTYTSKAPPDGKKGLLVVNGRDCIPASNIGAVCVSDNKLVVCLRRHAKVPGSHPLTTFILSFDDEKSRNEFHKKLVFLICIGMEVHYDGPL